MARVIHAIWVFAIIGVCYSRSVGPGFSKIVGGSAIDIKDVPYIAAAEFMGRFSCTGVIIGSKWILSSALCMDLMPPEDTVVRTGATEYEVGGHLYPVQNIYFHPNMSTADNYAADLALIELALDIVENESTKAIAISQTEPAAGTLARVSGWGAVAEDSIMHRTLLSVQLPIFDRTECNSKTDFEVTDLRLCTLQDGAGPCDYDEGDPLVVNGVLVGVKSWILKEQCGNKDRPSPYANLANPLLRDWIWTVSGI